MGFYLLNITVKIIKMCAYEVVLQKRIIIIEGETKQ